MSRGSVICVWEVGEDWKPGRGVGGSMKESSSLFPPSCFLQRVSLFLSSIFVTVLLPTSLSSTASKGCDKLKCFNSVVGNGRIFLRVTTEAFLAWFGFLFKKERVFRLPLSGCGLSTSCWVVMQWSPLKMVRVGGWHNPMTKACVLKKVAKQPCTSPKSHLECSCLAGCTASAQQLYPFSQSRHFRVAQLLRAVRKVLASIRTTTLEHARCCRNNTVSG